MFDKPTCNTYQPGSVFLRRDTSAAVSVPKTHFGLRCNIGQCEWFLLFPTRVGADRIESIRQMHIGQVHFTELVEGRCQISEERSDLCNTEQSLSYS